MKSLRINFLITLILIISVQLTNGQSNSARISNYDISAVLDTTTGQLNVRARLSIEKSDSAQLLTLMFGSMAHLDSVIGDYDGSPLNIPFQFIGKDSIQLNIPSSLAQTGQFVIEFIYSFPIGKLGDVPLLLDRGHRWYPLIPDNVAKMILTVAAPGNLEIFSAGDMTSTTKMSDSTRVTWESSWPVFKIPLLIANNGYYREVKRECNNQKEISLCYVSADSATAQAMLDEVCRSFEFFSQYIGEYSHNTFRLLEVPQFPGTNIGTGIITFGKDEIDAFKAGYSDRIDLAVAEQWMGAGIFGKFADRGFWFLSLSLPHYLRMMYLQKAVSEGAFQKSLNDSYNAYRPVAGTDKDIPILDVDFLNTKEKGVIIYGKGPYLVNFLRNKLGDEPWEMFWKALYRDYGGKVISFDQFCESLQGHDKDKTIIPEFRKLVGEKGLLPE